MRKSVAEVLLAPHRSYLKPIKLLMDRVPVTGMAHITGGGLTDNVPRVLPDGKAALIDRNAWRVPPVFRFIRDRGKVGSEEMFRVFNMGIGYVLAVRNRDAAGAMRLLRRARERPVVIGRIVAGRKRVLFEN
jgi:phosphoribosylformylglycinamidine cyclo-ligase